MNNCGIRLSGWRFLGFKCGFLFWGLLKMGVIGGENLFFAVFCVFLHFLVLFWQKSYKTLQKLGGF